MKYYLTLLIYRICAKDWDSSEMANPGSQQHSKNIAGPMMAQTIGYNNSRKNYSRKAVGLQNPFETKIIWAKVFFNNIGLIFSTKDDFYKCSCDFWSKRIFQAWGLSRPIVGAINGPIIIVLNFAENWDLPFLNCPNHPHNFR